MSKSSLVVDDPACQILVYLPNVDVRVRWLGSLCCEEDMLLSATLDSPHGRNTNCGAFGAFGAFIFIL